MILYNLMTCAAPKGGAWAAGVMGGCSIAWLVLALLFFLIMVLRRQCDDGLLQGINYNVVGALICGLGAAIILTTLFGQARWELLAGLVGVGLGGFGLGAIGIGGEGGGDAT